MSKQVKYWVPAGDLTEHEQRILAIPSDRKPAQDVYPYLIARKIQDLVDADPKAARGVLEMSPEHWPEMWMVAQDCEPCDYGSAIAQSNSMAILRRRIDWLKPGIVRARMRIDLDELVESLT